MSATNPTGAVCASPWGVKKDHMAGVIVNQLYKHTQMESSFGIILLAVVKNRPQVLNLKQILENFVLHRKEIVIRRTRFDLNKAEARAHILEGLKIALDNLDAVVKLIRESKTPPGSQGAAHANLRLDGHSGSGHTGHAAATTHRLGAG